MSYIPLLLVSAIGLVLLIFLISRLLQGAYTGRGFVIGFFVSLILLFAPLIYIVVTYVQSLLGITYSYVAMFYISTIVLFVLVIGLLLMINNIHKTLISIWQEIALLRNEVENMKEE